MSGTSYFTSSNRKIIAAIATAFACLTPWVTSATASPRIGPYVIEAGHPSLAEWQLPNQADEPADNINTRARTELGKKLFFDTALSRDHNMSCATCHDPNRGWSDGLTTAIGRNGKVLKRATPTITNVAFGNIFMWDGRAASLEDQAIGPMENPDEMAADREEVLSRLRSDADYLDAFEKAYPGEPLGVSTVSRAIAAFERTIISNDSRFDRWVKGDKNALSPSEVRGFVVFLDSDKGNCAVCHSAPNFSDNGFHNIGLASFAGPNPDLGRYEQRPVKLMRGAHKTPTLRDVDLTAPYFHDGSAKTLTEVVEHYTPGGVAKSNLSPEMKRLTISEQEASDLVSFLRALTSDRKPNTDLPNHNHLQVNLGERR